MTVYQIMDCDLHDYLEIACMHHYDLLVELLSGERFQAQASTTYTAQSKEEYLVLDTDAGQREVRIDRLLAITPLNRGASFSRIRFKHSRRK
ncbi:Rho-binding antiterminator [Saccharospirillum impatiens]|uniref:Rho-binding antiterminator n=1 Tax=Saccharospirillum impatiens TaxID=169438 RepID=UPI0004110792|nr:Rho-binding antiterminator [Saccharospirillum impatiens]